MATLTSLFLTPEDVQKLLDEMSEDNLDFLSQLCYDTVIDSVGVVEFPNKHLVEKRLHNQSARYNLQVEAVPKNDLLWKEVDPYEIDNLFEEDENIPFEEQGIAQFQLELVSTAPDDEDPSERLTIAAILISVKVPFKQIKHEDILGLHMMWLPELELQGKQITPEDDAETIVF